MHKESYVPEGNALLCPIQVGSALSSEHFPNILHDDEGENISLKNKSYCELTAQYWAWKNMPDLDYYGFFHYRRYLSFNPIQLPNYENIVYYDYCDDNSVDELMMHEDYMRDIITQYDVIYPQRNPIGGDTVYEHWCKNLEKKDLDILVNVIIEKYPLFYPYTKQVINSKEAIHCNMFIMKKEIFDDYCKWLFDILEECEKRIDFSAYSTEKLRTLGHFGERLCAIYSLYLENNNRKILYLQRTLFKNTEKATIMNIHDEKDVIPVVISCNNSYVKYASVLIESLGKNSDASKRYCIYLLNLDISPENKAVLCDQVKKWPNVSIDFINVNRMMHGHKNLFVDRHLSIETYFRFLLVDIFPNLNKVIYLDCDTVVNCDVAALYNMDLGEQLIGAARDVDILSLYHSKCERDPEVRRNIDEVIELKNYINYFQAGVLLLNLKGIRACYSSDQLFSIAEKREWKFQDQDVLNYAFKDKVKFITSQWNVLYDVFDRVERVKKYVPSEISGDYIRSREKPYIIHYAGTPKPWDDINVDLAFYFWKYAKTCPVYENLIHELIQKEYSLITPHSDMDNQMNRLQEENDILKWHLREIRNSFSYKLGLFLTYVPRKIREKHGKNNG